MSKAFSSIQKLIKCTAPPGGEFCIKLNHFFFSLKVTGGRNGYGAKLCNVFSTKFTVETACKEYGKQFQQSWTNNMSKAGEAKIKDFKGADFTRVTFQPDLEKFNMETMNDDTGKRNF